MIADRIYASEQVQRKAEYRDIQSWEEARRRKLIAASTGSARQLFTRGRRSTALGCVKGPAAVIV